MAAKVLKNHKKKKTIVVYNDGALSTGSLLFRLRETFNAHSFDVVTANTKDIVEGKVLNKNTYALFMPGVQDHHRSYRDTMPPEGWEKIRNYVEKGGAYVGICAGAYLATEHFEYKDPKRKVTRNLTGRLDFFEGKAFGPIKSYLPEEKDAKGPWAYHFIARLEFNKAAGVEGEGAACYSLGPYLTLPEDVAARPDYKILARYADVDDKPIAIASRKIGKGKAVFSGVLPEVSGNDIPHGSTNPAIQGVRDFAAELSKKERGRKKTWEVILREISPLSR